MFQHQNHEKLLILVNQKLFEPILQFFLDFTKINIKEFLFLNSNINTINMF